MVIWTYQGYFPSGGDKVKEQLKEIEKRINDRITKNHEKITIAKMYDEFLGGMGYSRLLYPYKDLEGEFFIDPYDWGWDEKGFRQLYRTRTIREEL